VNEIPGADDSVWHGDDALRSQPSDTAWNVKQSFTHQNPGPAFIRKVRAHLEHGLVFLPESDLAAAKVSCGGLHADLKVFEIPLNGFSNSFKFKTFSRKYSIERSRSRLQLFSFKFKVFCVMTVETVEIKREQNRILLLHQCPSVSRSPKHPPPPLTAR
jgi:hypothetical protein